MHPVQISCVSLDWRGVVARALGEIHEINLVHFLFATDVEFCEDIASKYSMDFTASPRQHRAFFRKRTAAAFKVKREQSRKFPEAESKFPDGKFH